MRSKKKKDGYLMKSEVQLLIQNYIRNIQMNDYGSDRGIPQLYAVMEQIDNLPTVDIVKGNEKEALDLVNQQKAEIERLNKNYEELIYKTECLLCHATGNKFSKYTYTTQEMISFVDDYIQDCCDEAVEEAKEAVKSEAIKEFAERLKNRMRLEDDCMYHCYGCCYECKDYVIAVDNLVKEMMEENK